MIDDWPVQTLTQNHFIEFICFLVEVTWMPLTLGGITMYQTRSVEAKVDGESIHGRSKHYLRPSG